MKQRHSIFLSLCLCCLLPGFLAVVYTVKSSSPAEERAPLSAQTLQQVLLTVQYPLLTPAPTNGPAYGLRHWPGTGKQPANFLCIQVESLNCGLEDLKHNGHYLMPFLHALKAHSLYYPYCFAYHEPGGSSDCEFSIFNNLEPTEACCMLTWNYPHPGSFIKLLPDFGYTPLAFHNNQKLFMGRGPAYTNIGFKYFYDFYDMQLPPPLWVSRDRDMFEYIIAHHHEWQSPFFLYVITFTSHKGFSHIRNYHSAPFLADIEDLWERDALTCFNYVDLQLQWFVTRFRELFPDTYIFIYGDHSLAAVKYAGHLVRSALYDSNGVLEFVPLFIITPDDRAAPFTHTLACFHDIGPTVLSLLPAPLAGERSIAYKAYGGSLCFDNVQSMPIPFSGRLYQRAEVLERLERVMRPYREELPPPYTGDQAKAR